MDYREDARVDNYMTLERLEKKCACGICSWCIEQDEEAGFNPEDLRED